MMEKKNYKKVQTNNENSVEEPVIIYQCHLSETGVTQIVTQAELDTECLTLQESKKRMIEKIHRHFHCE